MNRGKRLLGIIGLSLFVGAGGSLAADPDRQALPGIAPETVANYLHAIIEADRTFYTIHIVERMQNRGGPTASEKWRAENTLPLPAQFLMESGDLAAKTGTAVRYRLISLWPINPQNGAATELERKGLEQVMRHPERPATAVVTNGPIKEFQAIYADRAVTKACVACHNSDPRSPKKDFQLHDVMGGVMITIPLEEPTR
jgi:hypothetical protein